MFELKFRIRTNVFTDPRSNNRSGDSFIYLRCASIEEASLICEIDDACLVVPSQTVFQLSFTKRGPVIEGFQDCALGEFVRAQIEAFFSNKESPHFCELTGLEPFLDSEPERAGTIRDLISICEFRVNELTPESAIRFLKDSGFVDEYIVVGVKYGTGWRRSRCITTFEGRPEVAARILGNLREYFENETKDNPRGD